MSKLKIDRGTTFTIGVTFSKDSVATSLVGATVRFTMKTSEFDSDADDSDAILKKNITNGTAEGTATITINPTDTATLEPGDYFYDIKVDQDSNGAEVYKIQEGKIKLDGSPTNRLA